MDFVPKIVGGATSFMTGMGTAITDTFNTIFVTGTGETATISNLGIALLSLAGVSIGLALISWIVKLVKSR